MTAFVLKDYYDAFDYEKIATQTADSRFYRYKIFQLIAAEFAKLKYDIGSGLGRDNTGTFYLEEFERFKRFYIDKNRNASIKNENPRLMFVSTYVADTSEDKEEWERGAQDEFWRILDAIDLEFNGAATALPRIKERELKRGIEIDTLRQRLQGTIALATAIEESDSKWSMTDKEIKTAKDRRKKLRGDLNEALTME
jgi:hypothetical protein